MPERALKQVPHGHRFADAVPASESPNARKGIESSRRPTRSMRCIVCQNPRMPERALKRPRTTKREWGDGVCQNPRMPERALKRMARRAARSLVSPSQNPRMPERALKRRLPHPRPRRRTWSESPNARKGIETRAVGEGEGEKDQISQNPRMPERALKHEGLVPGGLEVQFGQNPRMPERALKHLAGLQPQPLG